jgi:Fic family protein
MVKKGSFPKREGEYIVTAAGGEQVRAYIPPALPPDPPLEIKGLSSLLEEANLALGRLDGIAAILPDTPLFLYMYVRKEALLSSQIEGTQSSLSDLLLYETDEAPGVPMDDVQEVSNYVAAMSHGLDRLRGGFPLSLRLMREIHRILLSGARGSGKQSGEFRRSQNWIGGTRPGNADFVPPPPDRVLDLMSDLERFIHTEEANLPLLIKAALVHVQFETIHPFLDGNGRLGRLLITFMLCAHGALKEPVLYLSLYFKSRRQKYYELLQQVREQGGWEAWLEFFLIGVKITSDQAAETAKEILDLFDSDRTQVEGLGRPASSALRVHQLLQRKPLLAVPAAVDELGISAPTVRKSVQHLVDLGIAREITGRKRKQIFVYDRYLQILNRGTEPL